MSQNPPFTPDQQSFQHNSPQNHASPQTAVEPPPSEITAQAQHYLSALSTAFETKQLKKTHLLERLFQDLNQALSDYKSSLDEHQTASLEENTSQNNLTQEHSSSALVNQPLSESQPQKTQPQKNQQLEKQHHLQWLCNQAQYYLTQHSSDPQQHQNRARWQIKKAVSAIAKFKLLVHLRTLLPGKAPKIIAWRDILPGFKL